MDLYKTDFIPVSESKNLKPLTLPDCAHLTERYRCDILRVDECRGNACPFRQNKTQCQKSENRWMGTLNTLSDETQKKIAIKYYNGKMPWKTEGEEW